MILRFGKGCSKAGTISRRTLFARHSLPWFPTFLNSCGSPLWYLADSGVPGCNQFAGAQGSFLKIRCVGGKNLPACHLFSEDLNGSQVRELAA
jgi:hypothetical protein